MAARIKQLEAENATLYSMTENLKYSEAVSRHKVEDLSNQVHSLSQERINLDTSHYNNRASYENTFGQGETFETYKQMTITEEMKDDGIEYMELDLNTLRRELQQAQH